MADKNEITEVKKNDISFSESLTNSLMEVKDGLPVDFNMQRFVQNAVALLNENEQLANFAKQYGTGQIKQGMVRASFLGLDFLSKEAYLIPYGKTLNFMLDYRGCKKLAKTYSIRPIRDIYAEVVRNGDEFSKEFIDGNTKVTFKPIPFNDSDVIGAFAVVVFEDGGITCETMSLKELGVVRSKSKSQNSMAWKDFTTEMYRKTILHRLCKGIELDFSAKQREIFDADVAINKNAEDIPEANDPFAEDNIIDIDSQEVEYPDFLKG